MKKNILIYIITGLLIISFGFIYITQQININKLEDGIEAYNKETAEEYAGKEKTEAQIENYGKRETIEGIAREELGLVYPDEKKYIDSNG